MERAEFSIRDWREGAEDLSETGGMEQRIIPEARRRGQRIVSEDSQMI
jgi:hypothetical protein